MFKVSPFLATTFHAEPQPAGTVCILFLPDFTQNPNLQVQCVSYFCQISRRTPTCRYSVYPIFARFHAEPQPAGTVCILFLPDFTQNPNLPVQCVSYFCQISRRTPTCRYSVYPIFARFHTETQPAGTVCILFLPDFTQKPNLQVQCVSYFCLMFKKTLGGFGNSSPCPGLAMTCC